MYFGNVNLNSVAASSGSIPSNKYLLNIVVPYVKSTLASDIAQWCYNVAALLQCADFMNFSSGDLPLDI